MAGTSGNILSAKQEKAIVALLTEPAILKAAEVSGIPHRTLTRWLTEPAFLAAFRSARRESFKHAVGLTQKYLPHAIQTLVQIMADKAAPQSSRVSASTALMKFSRESIELDDVVERVARLEQASEPNSAANEDERTP
jgi:uncharacterized protein (UPF0147 family)